MYIYLARFRTQKSLNFQGFRLPLALVMDLPCSRGGRVCEVRVTLDPLPLPTALVMDLPPWQGRGAVRSVFSSYRYLPREWNQQRYVKCIIYASSTKIIRFQELSKTSELYCQTVVALLRANVPMKCECFERGLQTCCTGPIREICCGKPCILHIHIFYM